MPTKKRLPEGSLLATERHQFKILLKRLTPSKATHATYLQRCGIFVNQLEHYFEIHPEVHVQIPILDIDLVFSELFSKSYLVARVDKEWFQRQALESDAVATPELRVGSLRSPPLVIIPDKTLFKKGAALSILEHEFVHVNQGILKRFPRLKELKNKPLSVIMNATLAEYEANFLQLVRWPMLYKEAKNLGISLKDWCILRGFTQVIEEFVEVIFKDELKSSLSLEVILESAQKQFPAKFQKIGLGRDAGIEYSQRLPEILDIATKRLMSTGRHPKQTSRNFISLKKWLKDKNSDQL